MTSNITFYTEDGQGNIYDDNSKEAMSVDESPSFRLYKRNTLPVDISRLILRQ